MFVPHEWSLPPLTEVPQPEPAPRWSPVAAWDSFCDSITGTGLSQAATLCAFTLVATGLPFIQRVPDIAELMRPTFEVTVPAASSVRRGEVKRRMASEASPLGELRDRTGLNIVQLAELFRVTRATIYSWQRGTPPRGEREDHLLEALAFSRSASEQFPQAQALKRWLMTPLAAGLETPLQLMAQRRWRPLRGLLLQARAPSSEMSVPDPVRTMAQPQSAAEARRAARRLHPAPAVEDLETAEGETAKEPSSTA